MEPMYRRLTSPHSDLIIKTHPYAEIVWWGSTLKHFSPDDCISLERPVANGRLDTDTPLTLMAENGAGLFGSPGLEGHRNGLDASPVFRTISVVQAGESLTLTSEDAVAGLRMVSELVLTSSGVLKMRHALTNLRDRIVQRAMLMAMEPIWESDFHTLSYGFRPESSVHHAIRTVKLQLTDCGETRGRWVIEGDLSSYFDTVHHRLLMKAVRRRISDARFMTLLWKTIKAGHIDVGLFRAASEGVPQGGVISPLLSNIMLNEFDQYLHERYLSGKARKDRWYWNNSIQRGRSTAVRENWQWKPAVAYCRYADDFVLIVKGTKAQAEAIREECRGVLEGSLKLRLNMDKTKITHVNDGFIFLGHRIIRKRSRYGEMRVVSTIPQEKARNFAASLTALLSGNYSESKVDMAEQLNRKLKGWAMFYQFVDFKAKVFSYIDRVVFWKLAHWLARKYRTGIASLMRWWCKSPKPGQSKTWVLFGKTNHGKLSGEILYRLVGQGKKLFRWRLPEGNPYLRTETRNTYTSRFTEVAMAFASI
ncbi:reverse transcriptase domain-containing protein [Escherichia sp. L584-2-1]